jgi:hypothetical protein
MKWAIAEPECVGRARQLRHKVTRVRDRVDSLSELTPIGSLRGSDRPCLVLIDPPLYWSCTEAAFEGDDVKMEPPAYPLAGVCWMRRQLWQRHRAPQENQH